MRQQAIWRNAFYSMLLASTFLMCHFGQAQEVAPPDSISTGQTIAESSVAAPELKKDLDALRAFRLTRNNNLKEFEDVAAKLSEKWHLRGSKESYFSIILAIVTELYDPAFVSESSVLLSQKYAKLALQDVGQMSVETEARFLRLLTDDVEYRTGHLKGQEWNKFRSEKVVLFLHFLQRVNKARDKKFDFSNPPALHPPLPAGVSGYSGMPPENIKDAVARAKYEKALAENTRKLQEFFIQLNLKRMDQSFVPNVEHYIARAYSRSPSNSEQLKALLQQYAIPAEQQKRILDALH